MKYIKMKYCVVVFIGLLLNGCNNNTISDNKIEVNKKQKEITNDQIIQDKQMIQNIMECNTEKIKLNNPFKAYRDKLIEKSMNAPVMTQQMKEDYKEEYGYYPVQYRHDIFNNDLHTTF